MRKKQNKQFWFNWNIHCEKNPQQAAPTPAIALTKQPKQHKHRLAKELG